MVVLAEDRQMVCGRISVGLSSFVLDAVCLGSSASMGHSTRLGSGLSSVCLARLLGGGLSVLNAISLGVVYLCESKLGVAQACHYLALALRWKYVRYGSGTSVSLGSFGPE
jgi:hypothetical protein